jgi:hypothetical protein
MRKLLFAVALSLPNLIPAIGHPPNLLPGSVINELKKGVMGKPDYPLVLHEGSMLGYRCQVVFIPDMKTGWVILTHTTDVEFSAMNHYIGKLLVPLKKKRLQICTNMLVLIN